MTEGRKIRFENGGGGAFYKEAKQAVDRYLAARGKSRFADSRMIVKALTFGGLALASYGGIFWSGLPSPALFGFAALFQLSALFLAVNLGHDAAHDSLFRSQRLNRLVTLATFTLLGVDGRLWYLRHRKSHHVFPNVLGCDADIDDNPFVRLSPHHPWRPHHRLQHLYAPLLYMLVAVQSIVVQDAVYLRKTGLANMRNLRHSSAELFGFWFRKAVYFTLCLGLPLVFLPLPAWQIVLGWLGATAVMSLTFMALLVGTHFAEEAAFPEVAEDGSIPRGWAEHAIATSVDWSPRSRFVHFFTGGFNTHATHHLFPNVSHLHYHAIDPLVMAAARRHGLAAATTDLAGLMMSHWRFLRRLGRGPGDPGKIPLGRRQMRRQDTAGAAAPLLTETD